MTQTRAVDPKTPKEKEEELGQLILACLKTNRHAPLFNFAATPRSGTSGYTITVKHCSGKGTSLVIEVFTLTTGLSPQTVIRVTGVPQLANSLLNDEAAEQVIAAADSYMANFQL